MNISILQQILFTLNEEELFYQSYFYAKQQEYSHQKFLAEMDMDFIKNHNLIIPELPETVPPIYEDYWIFDVGQPIAALKHNCFTPAIRHSHTFFELTYVYDGVCSQEINNRTVNLRTGDFLLIPPDIEHTISVFDKSVIIQLPVKKNALMRIFSNFVATDNIISMFFINSIYAQNVNDYIVFHSGNDHHIQTATLQMLLENINREKFWQQLMSNTLMNIFIILLRNYESSVELPSITKKTDGQRFALIRFIQDNYTNVNLDMIAKKFNYTPEYTSKLIKETTGMTFQQILRRARIERAEFLLVDTNLSVQNIGLQVGYENTENFIRTFKQVHNMTPTQYRKNKLE